MMARTQPDDYSCGIYSIINALIVYGENKSRREVGALTQTTENGTDEEGIKQALTELGYKHRVYTSQNGNNAWRWILRHAGFNPLILYVDGDHWLVVAGRIQNKVVLLDSLNNAHIVNKTELLDRWKDKKSYYGISITAMR
jgi:ABC-type bacteriocin/lantibiotic exporter with double-glycine peptidase domain